MKKASLFIVLCLCLYVCVTGCAPKSSDVSFDRIETGFRQPPDSVRLAAYWYWISDHISKEGVEKDLEAMKAAGITRVFIGNIGLEGMEWGEHKVLSPAWWEILHAALRKATELDIEVGIFNSPGWSQSGGPWVRPEESMRYLASSEIKVKGPQSLKLSLPSVGKDAQDVKLLAWPDLANGLFEQTWKIRKENGQPLVKELTLAREETIRHIALKAQTPMKFIASLYAKKGTNRTLLRTFEVDRSNPALNVGFIPYAPVVVALPETQANTLVLELSPEGSGELEVTLSAKPVVERYPEKTLAKMFQTPLPLWHDYLWEAQPAVTASELLVDKDRVIDLSSSLSADGTLEWNVPEGNWVISRYAMLTTGVTNSPASPEATGLEIDKMSRKHVATHFDAFVGEILRRIPEADRRCFKVVVQDSYETGGQNWTDDMIEKFKARYDYDPVPYLPVLNGTVVGSTEISDRFLWDLRRLIADRVSYDYVGGLADVSHQHGLTTWLENYGHWGFPGEFLQYGGQSDEVSGEFWSEGDLGDIENRAASSCAHIYGKRKVWAESFTSGGPNFGRYPATMKQRGDRFFTEGINATLLHLYIHQPYEDRNPGMSAWFGNDFHRKNIWFSQMDVFSTYLRRANFMLQQGRYVADVAYFIGEDAPKMTGVCDPELPQGYSFDYINAEVLLTRASVKEGRLVLADGMAYRLLVLPKLETMRPEVLDKISELVEAGLVVLGPAPKRSPSLANYPEADAAVQAKAAAVWNAGGSPAIYGKGKVFPEGYTIKQVFEELKVVPDFEVSSPEVLFIHRTTGDGDFYFVSNQTNEKISIAPRFRITGYQPELWNPLTGEIRLLPEFDSDGRVTTVPLELEAFESAFIVFRKKGKASKGKMNFPAKEVFYTVSTPWTISFVSGNGAPGGPIFFEELYDWKDVYDERIKYYSGEAIYTNTLTLKEIPAGEIYLDLGNVMVMAKVILNGRTIGGVWTPPYRLNVTDYVRTGDNLLQVIVVNNWQNRLIGDQQLPADQRPTWTPVNPWTAESPLQSSGLLGPVELQAYPYHVLKQNK
ncbi:glycosyl hydrolase [Parabacteroides sp. PF5-6]|uniref:glycosyl hydrolase n=1 Tax=Parabacteroides sp. PF5-6 TaxID=1742403 RepID=UPI0024065931|nr:glycosyl hydrolase [Parabacteroides sp. PF5-6]MDF9831545.1 hypothetical protein [Parabacteroides sp. PF5-6]